MSKCAIVTGGTKGIGKAIALALQKDGYHLVITYLNPISKESEKELLNEFNNTNLKVVILQADVRNSLDCQMVVEKAMLSAKNIDILVNNAGITRDNLLLKMTAADFQEVVDTNLVGAFNMIKVVSKKMMKQKYGRIINISSVIGEIGNVGQANYAASKAGLIGMTKSLAKELAGRNITVNCVAPGFIETKMTANLDERVIEQIRTQIPSKKLGQAVDVANAVLFLADAKTKYITGQVLNVCGGLVM